MELQSRQAKPISDAELDRILPGGLPTFTGLHIQTQIWPIQPIRYAELMLTPVVAAPADSELHLYV
jgi:hypothetical protein